MLFEGKVTTNKSTIREWVEARKGWPAVDRKIRDTEVITFLQIGFPESERTSFTEIPWDKFFEMFDTQQLAFLYEEQAGNGTLSHSFQFI